MQISQSTLNKLNILLQCSGWQNCRYSDCPHYSVENARCEWDRLLSVLGYACEKAFSKEPIQEAIPVEEKKEEESENTVTEENKENKDELNGEK